ncbi:MAG: hypothetical protein KIT58_13710 [Planctomycetota bacterium]|nr:hypothetical protein [Planctomycetota bacterium]
MTPWRWSALVLGTCVALVAWSAARTTPTREVAPVPLEAPPSVELPAPTGEAGLAAEPGAAPRVALDFVHVKLPLPRELQEREQEAALLRRELEEMGLGPDDDDAPGE